MRRTNCALALLLAGGIAVHAQVAGAGATTNANPATIIWGFVAIMGVMASGFFAMSLIWTALQGAIADHDQFHKLPRIVFWAAICFSATFIAGKFALFG